jgi:WhiB family redox-sensing transcriptional regulator
MTTVTLDRALPIGEASRLAERPPKPRNPRTLLRDPDDARSAYWDDANCRDMDAEDFFAEPQRDREAYNRAKRACEACVIRGRCLDYALKAPEQYGIWGGLDANERLRRRYDLQGWLRASNGDST